MDKEANSSIQSEAILHAQDYMQVLRSRWKTILLVFLLVFVSSAVITKMMTPKYMSGMSFEIKQPRDLINVAVGGEGNPIAAMGDSAAYMQTQFEILVSQQNLIAVANKLDLPNEWQVDETTASGIILATTTKEKPGIYEVVSAGPGTKDVTVTVKPGDKVVVATFVGTDIKLDGTDYKFVKQDDILAVVTD